MLDQPPVREEALEKALSSPAKSRILAACIRRPRSAKQISDDAEQPLASTYRQIRALVDDGLLVVERSAMTPDGKPYDLYRARVRSAHLRLLPDRVEVTWEPNLAVEDRIANIWRNIGA